VLDEHCDYSNFNFTWEPAPWQSNFRHAFASQWQKDSGTYLVPKQGFTETKYNTDNTVVRLQDASKWDNMNSDFDYSWHHDIAEPPYIYQFGTQHQKTGGPRYTVEGATNVKFVGEITTRIRAVASGTVLIKHLPDDYVYNGNIPIVNSTRFISNYLDTLVRVLKKLTEHEYVWVISDLCDYADFDFSWHPELWQHSMLHVFPSNEQKFGDTFFIHVESFLENAQDIKLLEWYVPLNFIQDQKIKRQDPTLIKFETDSVVDAVWSHNFQEPVVQFYKNKPVEAITISLWQERLRTVVPLVKGSESVIIPKDAKNYIKTQVYDYKWIDKKHVPMAAQPQDIVYISYDETEAEKNYQTLLEHTKDLPNQIHRITGVDGMQNALKAASVISTTPWSYQVFAKTELNPNFRFDFTPDYLQIPKHYIFHCHNTSNDLVYGHMGIVMYNNKMVKESEDYSKLGLDFTMSFPVEVVPELSCYGNFATSPYQAWRTAFRETSKLAGDHSIESKYRLKTWRERASGDHAEWVLKGANDGVDFYLECDGELVQLKQAFDWLYLKQRFNMLYNISDG
jgi:hypothetical protein